jgi:Rod binding domain-containing protein
MRKAASGHSMFDNEATRVFTGLLDHEFARKLTDQGGLGLADVMLKQLSKLSSVAPQSDDTVKKTPNLPIRKT